MDDLLGEMDYPVVVGAIQAMATLLHGDMASSILLELLQDAAKENN